MILLGIDLTWSDYEADSGACPILCRFDDEAGIGALFPIARIGSGYSCNGDANGGDIRTAWGGTTH
ncbi:protein of unknown function [Xenorhabdus nematophila AN6/1]|nr:hypothetical protein XNA1_1720033 [Xenorhabdus nematophila str. Anatoliense]CEE94972.1 hypothetical protein XNA1_4860034 [Xenorhabdus nematophila str. Anatoliense]CEF32078.1 hypothetical protein XNW1_4240011 [Xenorhabdus nematophila str. Websteri]CEK25006.1 protein of unknown function [Xenorhabdus nematophila AN6/1]